MWNEKSADTSKLANHELTRPPEHYGTNGQTQPHKQHSCAHKAQLQFLSQALITLQNTLALSLTPKYLTWDCPKTPVLAHIFTAKDSRHKGGSVSFKTASSDKEL